MILTTEIFENPLAIESGQITCVIERRTGANRVFDELLGCQLRLAKVANRKASTSHVQITDNSRRLQLSLAIQNVGLHPGNGSANWNGRPRYPFVRIKRIDDTAHGCFGRSVFVVNDQTIWKVTQNPRCQLKRKVSPPRISWRTRMTSAVALPTGSNAKVSV